MGTPSGHLQYHPGIFLLIRVRRGEPGNRAQARQEHIRHGEQMTVLNESGSAAIRLERAKGAPQPPFMDEPPRERRWWRPQRSGVRAGPFEVLVAHPNELMRRGIGAMVGDIGMGVAPIEATTYADARRQIRAGASHLLILPCLPYEAARELAAEAAAAGVKILVLLHDPDPEHLALAAELTADGFLLGSDLTAGSLEQAISSLAAGDMPMPPPLVKELVSALRERSPARRDPRPLQLTPREHQTLQLLAQGLSNKQIARKLGIREHGAKRHVANVLAKLNCPNRTMAVAQALREGLISEPDTRR